MTAFPPFRNPGLARVWPYVPPVLVGIFLRLWNLSGQILLDDEWHSLNFVLDKSLAEVLTTHGLGANCIPQNAINWLWLHTIGWSETALVLPSVVCGIAALLVFPPLAARLVGRPAGIAFAWFFALSPCAIFYARIARPYAMVIFFGFCALLFLALWVRNGRRRYALGYAASGFAAIYFHIYAALPVLSPLGALFLLALFRPRLFLQTPWIHCRRIAGLGLMVAIALAAGLGPAHWRNPWWLHVLAQDRVTWTGAWECVSLFAGTGQAPLKWLFLGLAGWGLRRLFRMDFRIGALFATAWASGFLLLVLGSQDGMHAGIQIARYNIILLPVAWLQAAVALAGGETRRPSALASLPTLLAILAFAAGSPLGQTFRAPNNFMHHSAFQESYAPFDWTRSRVRDLTPLPPMPADRIPAFYAQAAARDDVRGIIEYPMFIGHPANYHYFYQHFHRKPVAIGYVPDLPLPPLSTRDDFVFVDTPVDYVLGRAHAQGWGRRLRFSNLVPLTDPERLRRDRSGWLLVVHRDLLQENLDVQMAGTNYLPPVLLPTILGTALGPPIFADEQILAWRIP